VLRRKGIPATTIHSLIYRPVTDCDCKEPCDCPIVAWETRDDLDAAGFIVDEASMVGRDVHRDLMSFGRPSIFVGDHGQLPPVEAERTGFNLMADPQYRLEHVHRHAGDIPRFAEHLRNGGRARDFRPRSGAVRLLDGDALDDWSLLDADQILCATNRTRVALNARVRRLMGRNGRLEVGERVMCLRNDHHEDIQNGMQGTVVVATDGTMDIDTDDGPRTGLRFDPDQFGSPHAPSWGRRGVHPFDYAYCITCHEAQGGEWPTVLVVEEWCPAWDHRRWAYTAASRAQDRLWWRPMGRRRAAEGGGR
jgi:exodeoxyribonuclease-5